MNVLVSGVFVGLLCWSAWAGFTWESKVSLSLFKGQGEFAEAPLTEPYRSECSFSPFTALHTGAEKQCNNCDHDFSFHDHSDLVRCRTGTLCLKDLLWCIKSSAPYSQVNCLTSQVFIMRSVPQTSSGLQTVIRQELMVQIIPFE